MKIIIVEPQTKMKDSLKKIISKQPGMEAVGITDNPLNAAGLCEQLIPDMLLIHMTAENNAIAHAAQIRKEFPNIKIVIWTSLPYVIFADDARKARIHSFIDKNTGNDYLLYAINLTMRGKGIYCQCFGKTALAG
jgi:two-component system vancomycin resistance associated response regulator VraR